MSEKMPSLEEVAQAYLTLFEAFDGVSDEMSARDNRIINEHWYMYRLVKEAMEDGSEA